MTLHVLFIVIQLKSGFAMEGEILLAGRYLLIYIMMIFIELFAVITHSHMIGISTILIPF